MNAVTRRLSHLVDKPAPRYKDTRDRKSKEDSASHSQVMSKESEVKVDKPSPKAADITEGQVEKVSREPENRLFEVLSNRGIVRVCASSPINPGRLSNQFRTGIDRCTPTLPR